jgi:Arabinose-binding domain of AraC transcription regulator, N-term
LLKRAGVSEGDIDNPQRCISALAQGKLLEYAAEALGDNEFGLRLAQQANPREAGLFFYVASATRWRSSHAIYFWRDNGIAGPLEIGIS